MNFVSKLILATAGLATIAACSSEMSEEEQAIYDERKAKEDAKPTNMLATIQGNDDLSTANTAIGLSGVSADLGTEGPFTAFVGTNDAFAKIDPETLGAMMSADGKSDLADLLKYNVMIADMDSTAITKAIEDGGGTAELKMVDGGTVKATIDGEKLVLEDANGNKSTVIEANIKAANGIVHKVDTVLMP